MTTDLKSVAVGESLATQIRRVLGRFDDEAQPVVLLVLEVARRLEEAQQKIVAQQAALKKYGQHLEGCLWAKELPTGRGYFGCDCGFDNLEFSLPDVLAAHDAALKAEAKAEALEEAANKCKRLTMRGRVISHADCVQMLEDEAAEYRAKAGGKE